MLDGFDPGQVRQRFGKRFGLKSAQLAQIFSGQAIVLKKGLAAEQARHYVAELAAMGLLARARAMPPADGGPATPPSPAGYRIVFGGKVMPGFSREAVMRMSGTRLRFNDRQQAMLFSGQTVTIKRGLSEAKARNYIKTLRQMGMDVAADPALPGPVQPVAEAEAPDGATEASLMQTQFSASVPYNVQATFDGSSSLDMIRAGIDAADRRGDAAFGNSRSGMMQTIINPDAIREYEKELAEDPALAALRAAHDAPAAAPAAKAPVPVDFDFTAPPPRKVTPAAPAVESPPRPAPVAAPPVMPAPAPAPVSRPPEPPPPAAARTSRTGTLVAVLVVAAAIALTLLYLNGGV
ncbi:MAG: hypothetical protein DWQ11_03805 [Proteobacteria bacterium]|nr:MAG: hypothetical protein DWQ11_03805 [Pseudomonadota bacterium]